MTQKIIDDCILDFRKYVRGQLPDPADIGFKQIARIFIAYDRIIRPNFILWLMLTKDAAKTHEGLKVITENLNCEISQNHPQLLLNVTKEILEKWGKVQSIRNLCSKVSNCQTEVNYLTEYATSSTGFLILALLENASLEFIPWMQKVLIERFEFKNSEYFHVHGSADIEHANAFRMACLQELDDSSTFANERSHALVMLQSIFKSIFSYADWHNDE